MFNKNVSVALLTAAPVSAEFPLASNIRSIS